MSDNAEYDSLVNQKGQAQRDYDACAARIEKIERKLERLRPAKESITELKSAFKAIKKDDKELCNEDREWKGSTFNEFKGKMDTMLEMNDGYYKYSADHVLDSLNDEITRLENQKLSEYGLLGRLGSWINSLANKIENFFN